MISDGTVSTEVTTSDNQHFKIQGGRQAGGNLFHSFREFSIPTSGSAVFDNRMDVQNIIGRVTGNSISNIDGLIQANGSANLFLLNPNGIIFGSNAQLNIGGSFIATTAEQIHFADGTIFSATDLRSQPLLTVSIPVGLQFREKSSDIINRSTASAGFGLQVPSDQTLALVGGNVFLEGGRLFVISEGRVELGSVAAPAFVSLTPIAQGWTLGYDSVQNFGDIQLSQQALIGILAIGGDGQIRLRGRQIALTDRSEVTMFNLGAEPGGMIAIKASESVELSGDSDVRARAFSTGSSADILVEARRLTLRDGGSTIETATENNGRGGNLSVNAIESVEVDGGGEYNTLSTTTLGSGNAGNLEIRTGRLNLRNGGLLASSTNGAGNAGTVSIQASETTEIRGQGILIGEVVASGVFARTRGKNATGDGGRIDINTNRLLLRDGGMISVAANEGSSGQAGTLNITAAESIMLSGTGSSLLATSESPKSAGEILIFTPRLSLTDRSQISASTSGQGNAGNIVIQNAHSVSLDNSFISTEVRPNALGQGGNVAIQTDRLILQQGAIISAESLSTQGGNVLLNNLNTLEVNNSEITASTVDGTAGNLSVNARETVKLTGGILSVEATGRGDAGDLTLQTQQLTLEDGSQVSVSSPRGQAGNIDIAANSLSMNRGSITAETGLSQDGKGANINLQVSDVLSLDNESLISTTAHQAAEGGNIDINAKFLVAIPNSNSDITANALGGPGGAINITAQGIFGAAVRDRLTPDNDITAFSQLEAALNGIVTLNLPEVDPSRELTELPESVVDSSALIAQNPCKKGSKSEFTIAGRGGLPPGIHEDQSSEAVQVGLVEPAPAVSAENAMPTTAAPPSPPAQNPIVPARGWIFNDKGEVVLTTYNPTATNPQRLREQPSSCPAS